MAPSSDGLLSSILNDDDLQLMDPATMGADGNLKIPTYTLSKCKCIFIALACSTFILKSFIYLFCTLCAIDTL